MSCTYRKLSRILNPQQNSRKPPESPTRTQLHTSGVMDLCHPGSSMSTLDPYKILSGTELRNSRLMYEFFPFKFWSPQKIRVNPLLEVVDCLKTGKFSRVWPTICDRVFWSEVLLRAFRLSGVADLFRISIIISTFYQGLLHYVQFVVCSIDIAEIYKYYCKIKIKILHSTYFEYLSL